ncbi:MAG: hypothetical protein KY463_11715, partial [Actinobacteria bacterium]|nr:hypothetical protein [Actinomycetota bacterium]
MAAVLRPVLPDLAAETIRAIGREVPDYSRPLEGRLGVTLRYGTERALRRFVDSIEAPAAVSERDRRIYFELGRLETLPDPSLPRGGPGRDGYGHFRVTGIRVTAAPASGNGQPSGAVALETVKVDDSASPFDATALLSDVPAASGRKRNAWTINAMRDAERLPRSAVLGAVSPFGFPGGTR